MTLRKYQRNEERVWSKPKITTLNTHTEVYSAPCQTSKMEHFAEMVFSF